MLSICLLIEFMLIKMSAFWVGVKENLVHKIKSSLYRRFVI